MKRLIVYLFSLNLLASCSLSDPKEINGGLIGIWELDSISNSSGSFIKSNTISETLVFKKWSGCSLNTEYQPEDLGEPSLISKIDFFNFEMESFTGKYFILENPNRGLKTLIFVPDLQISGKDTIRKKCKNYDLVSLDNDRLVLIEETQWIPRERLTVLIYNKIKIYKKVKR